MNNPLGFLLRTFCLLLIQVMKLLVNTFFFFLPVGIYVLIIQFAKKMSATSSLSAYADPDKSEWMFIYPNTILVTTDANLYKKNIKKFVKGVDKFIEQNKLLLVSGFCITLLTLLVLLIVK